jgi:hypothetical protein
MLSERSARPASETNRVIAIGDFATGWMTKLKAFGSRK